MRPDPDLTPIFGLKTHSASLQRIDSPHSSFAKRVVWQESVAVTRERIICNERNKCRAME